jgi:trans-aconitate methyltransferase
MPRPPRYIFGDPVADQQRLLLQAQLFSTYIETHAPAFLPTPPTRILDLGCGAGQLTGVFHQLYPEATIIGVDSNPTVLAAARAQPLLGPTVTFVEGDIQTALPPGPFDLVYASAVLCHVRDLARVVELVAAALAPGGTFWVKDTHPAAAARATQPNYRFLVETFYTTMERAGTHPYVGTELPPLLAAHGFTAVEIVDDEVYPLGGESIEGESLAMDWIVAARTAAPQLSRVTGTAEETIREHGERLLAAAQTSAAPLDAMPALNILARRPGRGG